MNQPQPQDSTTTAPRVEVVIFRDPDGDDDQAVFLDGEQIENYEVTMIDPGKSWTVDDWARTRDMNARAASPEAADLIRAWFQGAADCYGHEFIHGHGKGLQL